MEKMRLYKGQVFDFHNGGSGPKVDTAKITDLCGDEAWFAWGSKKSRIIQTTRADIENAIKERYWRNGKHPIKKYYELLSNKV